MIFVAATVPATPVDSRIVPVTTACISRGKLPKTTGRCSSGGGGREFNSRLPDTPFHQHLFPLPFPLRAQITRLTPEGTE